jgi:hypothetical protein
MLDFFDWILSLLAIDSTRPAFVIRRRAGQRQEGHMPALSLHFHPRLSQSAPALLLALERSPSPIANIRRLPHHSAALQCLYLLLSVVVYLSVTGRFL